MDGDGHLDFGIDFSTITIPLPKSTKDPFDFSDPLYDQTVKSAVRSVAEMQALGWHDTTVYAPTDEIAARLETLLHRTPGQTYTRNKRSFEIHWTDEIQSPQTEMATAFVPSPEELAYMQMLMQDMSFDF